MKDKYEFSYQMSVSDLGAASLALLKDSAFFKTFYVFYALGFITIVYAMYKMLDYIERFIQYFDIMNAAFTIIVSAAIAVLVFKFINSKLKQEQLNVPCLKHESHLVITNINLQDSCDGYLSIIPYRHMKFFETTEAFGFIYNLMICTPIPKRLFENQAEIDEFRLFVQQNMVKSSL